MSSNTYQKTDVKSNEPRINDAIKAPFVRVLKADGTQLGQMSINDARQIADESGLDIVEISPDANPPVVKIIDYGKWRYNKEKTENKKNKDRKSTKEVRFSIGISDHDVKTKMKMVERFLKQGDNVMVKVIMRGRENAHQDIGILRMETIINLAEGMYKNKTDVRQDKNVIQCMFFA